MSRDPGPHSRRNVSLIYKMLFAPTFLFCLAPVLPVAAAESPGDAAVRIAASRWDVPEAELAIVGEVEVDGVTRLKILHLETGRIGGVDLDGDNQEVPADAVARKLAARRGAGFQGKKEKALVRKIEDDPAAGTTSVVVWAKTPGPPPRLSRNGSRPSVVALEAFKTHHKNATRSIRNLAERKGWTVELQSEHAPLIVIEVPNRELDVLEQRGDVAALYLSRVYEPELNVSTAAIDAPTVWARGITGGGMRTAVVEPGAIYYGHVNLADGSYCNSLTIQPINAHTTGVAGIIASTHATFRGVAHGAPAVLSGNAQSGSDSNLIACTEWAINNGARVINYSFGVDTGGVLTSLDRYVDYVVRYESVTMVKSAGNISNCQTYSGRHITSPGNGWNIIAVGNYWDRGTVSNADDVMNSSSCYGDPVSPNSDREKPEVAAPGSFITTTTCTSPSNCILQEHQGGTSFAAPHVVGCAALMMGRNAVLQFWPESIRAVLMATSVVNPDDEDTRLSEFDGAGGIECDSADDVVRGASGGEQHGVFYSTDFPKSFTFNATAGQTIRVAIAWDSEPDFYTTPPVTDELKADLDLTVKVPSGTFVTWSASRDNSYEIVELTAAETGTYTAQVSASRFDGSFEYLGFAWWAGTREDN